MKQIGNWVFGSFFRTIGRLLVFILLGFIIANLVDFGSIKDNFRITDLFFYKVDALTYTTDLKQVGSAYIDYSNIGNQNIWTATDYGYYHRISSVSTDAEQSIYMQLNTPINTTNVDFVSIPFSLSQPIRNLQTGDEVAVYPCTEFTEDTDQWGNKMWVCTDMGIGIDNPQHYPYTIGLTSLNFYFNVEYVDDNGNWAGWNTCDLDNGNITCPTTRLKIKYIHIHYTFRTAETTYANIYLGGGIRFYNYNDATSAINEQTQQQQQQHNETQSYLEDSNTTQAENEASEFFEDFEQEDFGGLSAIITAPLNTIRSLLNSSCTNLVLPLPYVNENLTLPCMTSIYTTHFGAFFTIYQTIILAIIAYRCIRSIYYDIHGFTNPNDDRIEVMDL